MARVRGQNHKAAQICRRRDDRILAANPNSGCSRRCNQFTRAAR